MDNIMLNMQPTGIQGWAQGAPSLRGLLALGGLFGTEGGGMGGDFLSLVTQQLASISGTDAPAMLSARDPEGSRDEAGEEADPWMQMLAGVLATDGISEQTVLQLLAAQPTEQAAQLLETIAGVSEDKARAAFSPLEYQQEREAQPEKGDIVAEVLEIPQKEASKQQAGQKQQDGLLWSGRFQSAVTEAQKLLQAKGPQDEEAPVNVETLQSGVSAGRYAVSEASADKGLPLPEARDVAEQVRGGIARGLSNTRGKNEFVVKLKPEGLGEVVVRLSENAGRMTLNIVTSSEQTARLLNSELAGLRESLRPWNADVREVVSQQQQQHAENSYEQARHGHEQAHSNQRQDHGGGQPDFAEALYGEDELEERGSIAAGVYV